MPASFRLLRRSLRLAFCLTGLLVGLAQNRRLWTAGNAEAYVAAAAAGVAVVVAVRHAGAPRIAVPTAATKNAGRACRGTGRISLGSTTIRAIPVSTPFPNISGHIIYAKLICLLGADLMRAVAAVINVPCHIAYSIAAAILVALAA
jgi:hypothetical protein